MSGQYRRDDDEDLAYGDHSSNRGYYNQPAGSEGQDRGIIGDTFKKFKSKYDQHQSQWPQQDFGYGSNPSSSTVGSQQQGGSGYAGGPYNPQGQYGQPGQPAYPGGPPPQKPQQKPGFPDKILGGLLGSVTSIGDDVQKMFSSSSSQRPPQNQGGYNTGSQSNPQTQTSGTASKNRYDSTFAGPKAGNDVKWYVDGCSYMWAVSQALENARETIWILDWWLSPELYLRRPPARNEEWRIDKVIQRAANRGVKVNIIVYKEVTQALTLSSAHTKHALEALSPNIGVFRHPDHLPDAQTAHSSIVSAFQGMKLDAAGAARLGSDALKGLYGITDGVILYWAHHEKLCLIDGQIAFMGGLDLCYGRWDTNQHSIADAHPSDLNKIVFPGQDFNNARVMDFSEVDHPFQNKVDRTKSSRMGWSDISICLKGPCVGDLIHHFADRWNFIYDEKYNVRKDTRYARLPDYPQHRRDEGPGAAPTKPVGQTGGQPGQAPVAGGYQPPPWQGAGLPTTTTAFTGSNPNLTQQVQSPQNYPPPPPGPPPISSGYNPQYQQPYSSNQPVPPTSFTSQPGSTPTPSAYQDSGSATSQSGQTTYGANQVSGYQASSGSQTSQYNTPQQIYSQEGQIYGQQQATASFPVSQSQYQQASTPTHQPEASQQPSTQYPVPTSFPTTAAASTSTYQDSSQYQPQSSQAYGQNTAIPTGPPIAQIASQQYAAYVPQTAEQPSIAGSHATAELGAAQYRPYDGQPTARGLDDSQNYDQHYTGSRGFGSDSYGYDQGDDRAFGRGTGTNPGRFDKYKEEARRLQHEGKFFGHDIGRYGNKLEARLDDTLTHHTGGRIGRPQSSQGGMSCQLVRSCTTWSNGTNIEKSVQNAYIDLIQNSKHFVYIENQFFITATGDKQKPVKNMIGKAIVERVLRAAREQQPFKIIVNIPSVPAFAGDLVDDGSLGTRAIMEFQYFSICRGGHSIMEEIANANVNPMDYIRFYNLRNYDRINITPAMQQAQQQSGLGYDDARKQYESHLGTGYGGYGEIAAPTAQQALQPQSGSSQYDASTFQSQSGVQAPYTAPPISQQTYSSQPGTQYGQTSQQQPYTTQQQTYSSQVPQFPPPPQQPGYGSQHASQGYNQYQQVAQAAPEVKADDWDSVTSCYMLGGQDIRSVPWSGPAEAELNAFVSEELYIHSKVMIVDDQTVICGSANLNDRSMLGSHDSEIALIINDNSPVQSTMAGRPWQANRFAASLRRQLFRKHLGLIRPQDMQRPDDNFLPVGVANAYDWGSPEDHVVSDPLSDTFLSLWNSRARTNTEVYRKAFRAVPDDTVKTWADYKEFYEYYFAKSEAQAAGKDLKQKISRVEYGHVVPSDFPGGVKELKDLLSQVKGTLVEMPLCFLQNEDIAKENYSFNSVTAELYT